MKKPQLETRKYLDYDKCAKYVAFKLGIKDIRDVTGHFQPGGTEENNPYQDFWHFICDICDPNNGSYICIGTDMSCKEDWQQKICDMFVQEFGEEQDYWVEW